MTYRRFFLMLCWLTAAISSFANDACPLSKRHSKKQSAREVHVSWYRLVSIT